MAKTKSTANTDVLHPVRRHQAFLPLIVVTGVIWYIYRLLFSFPVWFDETLGKLVFFALPVVLYSILAQTKLVEKTLSEKKFMPGLWLGLAFGGMFGFVGLLAMTIGDSQVIPQILFLSSHFWWEFFLALLTGFWESLFFFGWIYTIAEKRFPDWELIQVVGFCSLVFVLFHIPNTLLRLDLVYFLPQIFLLTLFSIGQALLFHQYRNIYALTLTHAIWGMVLLVYGR